MRRVRIGLIGLLGAVTAVGASLAIGLAGAQGAGATATPTTLTVSATPNPAPVNASVQFSATLSGGRASPKEPKGSITLLVYSDNACSSLEWTLTNNGVDGNGTYTFPDVNPSVAETYYGNASFTDSDGFNASSNSTSCAPILTVVPGKQATTLTLKATPNPAPTGATVKFVGTLSGGLAAPNQPQGDLSMSIYLNDPTCSSSATSFDTSVNGNGSYVIAKTNTLSAGTYYGDAYFADSDGFNQDASSGSCDQIVVVNGSAHQTSLSVNATPQVAPHGATVDITATLTGGLSQPNQPTGNIAGGIYSDSNCNTLAFDTNTAEVNGNGTYTLDEVSPPVGTYYGSAYFTDTDGYNNSVSSGSCQELFQVVNQKQQTSLSLNVNPQIAAHGTEVHFHATLSGGLDSPNQPTGTISLKLYSNKNCTTVALTQPSATVDGNGTYSLGSATPAKGTYYGFAQFHDTDGFNTNSNSGGCKVILVVN